MIVDLNYCCFDFVLHELVGVGRRWNNNYCLFFFVFVIECLFWFVVLQVGEGHTTCAEYHMLSQAAGNNIKRKIGYIIDSRCFSESPVG